MLNKLHGFSLVEVLIVLFLGATLLAMVLNLYVTGVSTGAKNLKYARLRADLQSIITVIETDIRRAGYGGSTFMVGSGANKTIDIMNNADKDCIVYYYNHNHAHTIGSANKMGIRFNAAKQEIQFGTGVDPLAANCYQSGYWKALSDKSFINITSLDFIESVVSDAVATMRSVQIDIKAVLVSEQDIEHRISSRVQVRNLEFN